MVQIKLFKDQTPKMEKFEKQVNNFLSEHKDTIIVRDIKYSADYPNPNNSAWQNWTAMVIYEVVNKEVCMVQSDLYICGSETLRMAIVKMVMGIAEHIGVDTADEIALNIPMGMLMEVLIGDSMHTGLLVGINTEDPECVVMRVAMPDAPSLTTLYDALNQCYNDIEIEVDEDVENVPWPY